MRRIASLETPLEYEPGAFVYWIMLCEAEEGVYLFGYDRPDAVRSSFDRCYGSAQELHEDWDALIDEKGWTDIGDPLPYCQQDAPIPLRVKGREAGRPEWGRYEMLRDGQWVEYRPEEESREEEEP